MKTFLKVMRQMRMGKFIKKFNNKVDKRQSVKLCIEYEEMIENLIAENVTRALLGEWKIPLRWGIDDFNKKNGIKSSI